MTRKKLQDADLLPLGKFAVLRHSSKLSRAHFSTLHDTYEGACAEATRLLILSIDAMPEAQHHYYVMEVTARFSGGAEGFASVERMD